MYGVLSFLPVFIQPWPKNSLYNGNHFLFSNQSHHRLICASVHVRRHLLIRDDLEDQVVQQGELLSYLQSGMVLKGLCLTVQHSLRHTTRRLFTNCSTDPFKKDIHSFKSIKKDLVISHHLVDFLQGDLVVSRIFLSDSSACRKKKKNSNSLIILSIFRALRVV